MVKPHKLMGEISRMLEASGVPDARFDAGCLLSQACGCSAARLLMLPEIPEDTAEKARAMAVRRANGEPLQYILGEWEFYGLRIEVGEGVLIPRPDTETLADAALQFCRELPSPRILDLCTGSGCIACALAKNLPDSRITAMEKSPRAIAWAERNIAYHHLGQRTALVQGDVLSPETPARLGHFHLIVCNPPYLSAQDMENLQKEVEAEPKDALYGGTDGFRFYEKIPAVWKNSLSPGGMLAFEAGAGQAGRIAQILEREGFADIRIKRDLCGTERVVTGIRPSP